MGHINYEVISHLLDLAFRVCIKELKLDREKICETCVLFKITKQLCSILIRCLDNPFDTFHYDMIFILESYNSHKIISHTVCKVLGFYFSYSHSRKTKGIIWLLHLIIYIKKHHGIKICIIYTNKEKSIGFKNENRFTRLLV